MSSCFKCHEAVGTIMSRDGASKLYCADCFCEFCTKMVRNALLTQCQLPSHTPVAVAVSGGPSSMLLMHQLGLLRRQALLRQGPDAMRLVLVPFHLNESELILPPRAAEGPHECAPDSEVSTDAAGRLYAGMASQFARLQVYACDQPLQWEWASAPLFAEDEVRVFHYSELLTPDAMSALADYLHHPKLGLSDREEMYARVRQRVLCLAAHDVVQQWHTAHPDASNDAKLCNTATPAAHWVHVLLGSHAVGVTVDVLHELVCGAGGAGVSQAGGYRSYVHGVMLLRPLRALMPREIVLYHRSHGGQGGGGAAPVTLLYTPALVTGTALRSIRRTLENSVQLMARSYPSMVFNVLSMVGKLRVQPEAVEGVVRGVEDLSHTRGRAAQASHRYLCQHAPPSVCYTAPHSTTTALVGSAEEEVSRDGTSGSEQVCVRCCLLCGYPFPTAQLHAMSLAQTRYRESDQSAAHAQPHSPKRRRVGGDGGGGMECERVRAIGADETERSTLEAVGHEEDGQRAAHRLAVCLCNACLPSISATCTSSLQSDSLRVVCDMFLPLVHP